MRFFPTKLSICEEILLWTFHQELILPQLCASEIFVSVVWLQQKYMNAKFKEPIWDNPTSAITKAIIIWDNFIGYFKGFHKVLMCKIQCLCQNHQFVRFFLLFIIVFVVIIMSPSLFLLFGRIVGTKFSADRTAIYPNIIANCLVWYYFFQKFFFHLICFLNSFIKVNIFFPILLIFIIFNLFYTSFSNSILTESLFFSFINFTLAILLSKKNNIFFAILLGIFVGLIITIKPIGFAIAAPVIIFYILKSYRSGINSFFFIIIFLLKITFFQNMIKKLVWKSLLEN